MKKRIIAIVLSLVFCFSCVVFVFADDAGVNTVAEEESTDVEVAAPEETTTDEPAAEEPTTAEPTTEAPATEAPTENSGFSFDISIEDILNSDIVLGILGSDGFMDITNLVIEVMAMLDRDNLQNMASEEVQKIVQSAFETIADAIMQVYGNRDLIIKYDPLKVLRNLLDLDEDFLQSKDDGNGKKDPNELEIGLGDVDGDGRVTAADARLVLRRAAQVVKFTLEQDARADIDKDGKVTAKDARILLRYCAGLLTDADSEGFGFTANVDIG